VKIDETYVTPVETHNPMELHASVSIWDGSKFTLYETTQGVVNHRAVMAQVLGVPKENVQVISRFLGSGFGGKLFPWPHSALAAAASRDLNRPVKLVISRSMMFSNVGHRPLTQQRVRLAATPDGKLVSFQHDYVNHTSILHNYEENCGEATPYLYSVPNLRVSSGLARRNVGTPTAMRGPGAVPGLFATESAMDELAIKLNMDPVEFRFEESWRPQRFCGLASYRLRSDWSRPKGDYVMWMERLCDATWISCPSVSRGLGGMNHLLHITTASTTPKHLQFKEVEAATSQ